MKLRTISRRGEEVHEIDGVKVGDATDADLNAFLTGVEWHRFGDGSLVVSTDSGPLPLSDDSWIIRPVNGPVQFSAPFALGRDFEVVEGQ